MHKRYEHKTLVISLWSWILFLLKRCFFFSLIISRAANVHRSAKRDGLELIRLTKPTLSLCVPEVEQNVSSIFLCPVGGQGVNEMKQGWFSGGAWASMITGDAAWISESTLWSFFAFDRAKRRNVWEAGAKTRAELKLQQHVCIFLCFLVSNIHVFKYHCWK